MRDDITYHNRLDAAEVPNTALTRRTWLIVGLVSFAMLLMSVTGMTFHHRLHLSSLFEALNSADRDNASGGTNVGKLDGDVDSAEISTTPGTFDTYSPLNAKRQHPLSSSVSSGTKVTKKRISKAKKGASKRNKLRDVARRKKQGRRKMSGSAGFRVSSVFINTSAVTKTVVAYDTTKQHLDFASGTSSLRIDLRSHEDGLSPTLFRFAVSDTREGTEVHPFTYTEKLTPSAARPVANISSAATKNRNFYSTFEISTSKELSMDNMTHGTDVVPDRNKEIFEIKLNSTRVETPEESPMYASTFSVLAIEPDSKILVIDTTESEADIHLTTSNRENREETAVTNQYYTDNHRKTTSTVFSRKRSVIINETAGTIAAAFMDTLPDSESLDGSVDDILRERYNKVTGRNVSNFHSRKETDEPASWFCSSTRHPSPPEQTSSSLTQKDGVHNRIASNKRLSKKNDPRSITSPLHNGSPGDESSAGSASYVSSTSHPSSEEPNGLSSSTEAYNPTPFSEQWTRQQKWPLSGSIGGAATTKINVAEIAKEVDIKNEMEIIPRLPDVTTVTDELIPTELKPSVGVAGANDISDVTGHDWRIRDDDVNRLFDATSRRQANRTSGLEETEMPHYITGKRREPEGGLFQNESTKLYKESVTPPHRSLQGGKNHSGSVQTTRRITRTNKQGEDGISISSVPNHHSTPEYTALTDESEGSRISLSGSSTMDVYKGQQTSGSSPLRNRSSSTLLHISPGDIREKSSTEDFDEYLEFAVNHSSRYNTAYNLSVTNSVIPITVEVNESIFEIPVSTALKSSNKTLSHTSTESELHPYSNLTVPRVSQAPNDRDAALQLKSTVMRMMPTPQTASNDQNTTQSPDIVCTYHRIHANWQSANTSFNLVTFPYQYCRSIVYCCVGFDLLFYIDPHEYEADVRFLKQAKKLHPGLKTFVAIGGSKLQNSSFETINHNTLHQEMFVRAVVTWLLKRNFDGVYMYWTYPEPQDTGRLVRTTGYLVRALRKSNLQFGLILPSDEELLRGFDIPGLAGLLKDIPAGILLAPPERKKHDYNKTEYERADDLLKGFARLQEVTPDVSSPICPMLPFAGSSFKLQAIAKDGDFVLKAVSEGKPGSVSGEAGKLAYFEVCQQLKNGDHFVFSTRESVLLPDGYITYLTPRALSKLLGIAAVRRPFRCLGAWEPEWDDFGGVCGTIKHPLLRALYTFLARRSLRLERA